MAGDPRLLHLLNSKLQARGGSGKFITLYPPNESVFAETIEQLYQRTKDTPLEGPYVLSDWRYKDSRILFYRYGGFHPVRQLNSDGTRTLCLVSPSGEYVPDERHPYPSVPEWVQKPFDGEEASVETEPLGMLLNGRYRVEGAIGFSNAGGIYAATDTLDGGEVVIKEARPMTNWWSMKGRSWDAVYLLRRELEVMRRLQTLAFVPEAVELFEEGGHTFLVQERVDGISLDRYWAQDEMILAPYIRRPGSIERFVTRFKYIAQTLLGMVTAIHEQGVLLGDLSPRNVLLNPDTLECWIIDFESAALADDDSEVSEYAARWGTAGFQHPERERRRRLLPRDDFYALAMTLYSCVVPITNLFSLCPAAQEVFLDKLISLGLPPEVKRLIQALAEGRVEQSWAILNVWHVGHLYAAHA
jgi:hypothetical protein